MKRAPTPAQALHLIVLTALCVLGLGWVIFSAAFPALCRAAVEAWADWMTGSFLSRILIIALAVLLAALVVWTLRHALRRRRAEEKSDEALALDGEGRVSMSRTAIASMVRQIVGEIPGVAAYDVAVSGTKEALDIALNMTIRSGSQVPQIADEVQKKVSETLCDTAGVEKTDVKLVVTGITE